MIVLAAGVWRIGTSIPDHRPRRSTSGSTATAPTPPATPPTPPPTSSSNVRPATGRLINEYTWGGYLEWRLGDRFQALLDGRTQCFSREFWRLTYLAGDEARREFFSRHPRRRRDPPRAAQPLPRRPGGPGLDQRLLGRAAPKSCSRPPAAPTPRAKPTPAPPPA